MRAKLTIIDAALEKLSKKIENYLKSLIEVNLKLIQEEAEDWEKRAVEERREDEFLDWDVTENEEWQ